MINILAAEKLMQQSPKIYATFLLWLLSELFERLPELVIRKNRSSFSFLTKRISFADIEPAVEQKVEQMVWLIRSKGVGFISSVRTPSTFRTLCSGNWGIGCNTLCAL